MLRLNRLWAKVVIPTGIVLILVTALITFMNTQRQTKALTLQLAEKGRDAAIIVKDSVISALTIGDNEDVKKTFCSIENEMPDMNLFICDSEGRVSFTSEKGGEGKSLSSYMNDKTYAALSTLLGSGTSTHDYFTETVNGKPYITVIKPFLNGSRCYHCHGRKKRVLGAIVVQAPAATAVAAVDAARKNNIIMGIVTILVVGIVLFLIVIFFVNKPVNHILEVLQAFAKGDLSKKIDVKSNDEIGQMADALKEMLNGVIGEGQSLKHGITIPFFMVNKDLVITFANKASRAKVGAKAKDVLHPDAYKLVEECMKTGEMVTGEVSIAGGKLVIASTASPLRNLEGEIIGAMGIGVDITAQKEQERMAEEHSRFLSEVAEEVTDVANQVASAAEEMSAIMKEMVSGAEEQSQQASQIAAAVEQMSATIMEMANNARDAANVAEETKKKAGEGSEVVHQSIESINRTAEVSAQVASSIEELAERSKEIGKVIEVISDIASQTNLLALNATIEAASAGEAGKGFAVVASEVKELAKQTADSTGNVQRAIENIHQGVAKAVKSMDEASNEVGKATSFANEAGAALMEILERVDRAVDAISQIATATEELSAAANNVSENVMNITSISNETANSAKESAVASERLAELSERLLATVRKFKERG